MTTIFQDDFSGDLSKWTVVSGNWSIANGKLSLAASGGWRFIKSNSPILNKYKIAMDISNQPAIALKWNGITQNTIYQFYTDTIYRYDNGAGSTSKTWTHQNFGLNRTVEIAVDGDSVKISINGIEVASDTMPSILNNTFALGSWASAETFDNVMMDDNKKEKILIKKSDGVYVYLRQSDNIWQPLGHEPTVQDFLDYGMDAITSTQLRNFESIHGKNYRILRWTDGNAATKATLKAIPQPQLIFPNGDIPINGVESIDQVNLIATGNVKVALSFDNGITYHAYNGTIWEIVSNASEGMAVTTFNALTNNQFSQIRNGSNFIRFSYWISGESASVDKIEMKVSMAGYNRIADTSKYSISYDEANHTVKFHITQNGTYFATYVNPSNELRLEMKEISKLNVTAPYTHVVTLNAPLQLKDIATTVLQFVGNDSGVVQYNAQYNNGEASSFIFNEDEVMFDGFMKMRDTYTVPLTEKEMGVYYESDEIDFATFLEFSGDLIVNKDTLTVTIPGMKYTSSIIEASDDISISGVESLDKINWVNIVSGNGISKLILSFDRGATWNSYNGASWMTVDIQNKADFEANGMDRVIVDALTNAELSIIRNGSEFIRFAYYLEKPTMVDEAKNDKIELIVTMLGYNEIAPTVNYTYSYNVSTKELTYQFNVPGTYTLNYVDSL